MRIAAKNAKCAEIGGWGLSAFAISAFFAAKSENGMRDKCNAPLHLSRGA